MLQTNPMCTGFLQYSVNWDEQSENAHIYCIYYLYILYEQLELFHISLPHKDNSYDCPSNQDVLIVPYHNCGSLCRFSHVWSLIKRLHALPLSMVDAAI